MNPATSPDNSANQPQSGTIEIDSLDTFVKLLSSWHSRKVKTLEHFLQLPEGQVVQIGEDPEFVIAGDVHKGFITGINLALMEIGVLPFSFEMEDAGNDSDQLLLPIGEPSAS